MKNLNLTPRAQKLIKESLVVATDSKSAYINHLHIFAAFLNLKQSQIDDAFFNFKYNIDDIKKKTLLYIKNEAVVSKKTAAKPVLSEQAKLIFKCAKEISAKYDHKYIGLEHIFISLFEIADEEFINFLDKNGFNFEKVIDFVENKMSEDDLLVAQQDEEDFSTKTPVNTYDPKKYKTLNTYAVNLNAQVVSGKINNLHINKELIQKISEVLCRKNKNNPLIVGEAGVGKSSIAEGIALLIKSGSAPRTLIDKKIYSLDYDNFNRNLEVFYGISSIKYSTKSNL